MKLTISRLTIVITIAPIPAKRGASYVPLLTRDQILARKNIYTNKAKRV
jgi:hypothetical protein